MYVHMKQDYVDLIFVRDNIFRIYSIKNDNENQYIYRLWDYEGAFYKKIE